MNADLQESLTFEALRHICLLLTATCFPGCGTSIQVESSPVEIHYDPPIARPAYPKNQGPTIFLDEGHYNRHIYGGLGGLVAFKDLLSADGYQIKSFKRQFTPSSLREVRILVTALPQDPRNLGPPWRNPTHSAFTQSEIDALERWVGNGGSLLLIVDHHPFAGAADSLAHVFGFKLFNGHAEDMGEVPRDIFRRDEGTLRDNAITRGRNGGETISAVKTFGGAAMTIPETGLAILEFDDDWVQYLPDTAWDFSNIEPECINGLSQGAYMTYGSGKVVVFGDGNMFSAQIDSDGEIAGFIDTEAQQNYQLLLNIIHYLDGLLR